MHSQNFSAKYRFCLGLNVLREIPAHTRTHLFAHPLMHLKQKINIANATIALNDISHTDNIIWPTCFMIKLIATQTQLLH